MNYAAKYLGITCALFAGAIQQANAQADSEITLYGVVDAGVTYVSNEGGHSNRKLDTGIEESNYWGIKGKENLGGGLHAVFQLESGFALDTGHLIEEGKLFNREALVGLSNQYGSITLGNQSDLIKDYLTEFNISAVASGYAVHQGDFAHMSGHALKNSVKFSSAEFNGFSLATQYALGEHAGSTRTGSAWGIGLRYANGPLALGSVYQRINQPEIFTEIDPAQALGVSTFLGQSVAPGTPVNVDSQSIAGLGVSYHFGSLTLMSGLTDTRFKGFGLSSSLRVAEAGGQYDITPALKGIIGYQHSRFEDARWNQVSLGLNYALSKRTDVYLASDFLRASNGVNAVIGASFEPSGNSRQSQARLGMRHVF